MSEMLERAGRSVVDDPVSSPLETAELERRVSRRRTRRAASIVACVAIVGLAGAAVVAFNGGDKDATQPIVTDGSTPEPEGLGAAGVLINDGAGDTATIHELSGRIDGTIALREPIDPDAQNFIRYDGDGSLELDARTTFSGTDGEGCTFADGYVTGAQYKVCASHISALDADGAERQIIGLPEGASAGHWGAVMVSPDGESLLAEFLGECDSPTTYFLSADGSDANAATGPDLASAPVGWLDDERAVVTTAGRCGQPADAPMGVVIIAPAGIPAVIYEAEHPDDLTAALWTRLDQNGTPATQSARQSWAGLDAHDYTFDFEPRCFCDNRLMHVTVVDDNVTSVVSTADGADLSKDLVETIPKLLDRIATSELNRDAGTVEVRYDERGVPTEASIDTVKQAVDDEYAWTLTNLVIESHQESVGTSTPSTESTATTVTTVDPGPTTAVPFALEFLADARHEFEAAGFRDVQLVAGPSEGDYVTVTFQYPPADEVVPLSTTIWLWTNAVDMTVADARAKWDALGIDDYSFRYRETCFCDGNPLAVDVENGVVVSATSTDPAIPDPTDLSKVPTIPNLFDRIANFPADLQIYAHYSPELGYPLGAGYSGTLPDSTSGFEITSFTRG